MTVPLCCTRGVGFGAVSSEAVCYVVCVHRGADGLSASGWGGIWQVKAGVDERRALCWHSKHRKDRHVLRAFLSDSLYFTHIPHFHSTITPESSLGQTRALLVSSKCVSHHSSLYIFSFTLSIYCTWRALMCLSPLLSVLFLNCELFICIFESSCFYFFVKSIVFTEEKV